MWLTVLSGPDAGKRVEVSGRRFVLGRVQGCDLVIRDGKASRRHTSLEPLPDGRVRLRDVGSANGTHVDGREVAEAVLAGGEEVRVGDTVLLATREAPPAAAEPEARKGPPEPGRVKPPEEPPEAAGPRAPEEPPAPPPPAATPSAIQRIVLVHTQRATRAVALGSAAAVLATAVTVLLVTGVVGGGDASGRVQRVVEAVARSTVLIAPQAGGMRRGTGSGWVLDADEGLVVTNAHVVNQGSSFKAGPPGALRDAEVVGVAPCEDLAVLRVALDTRMRPLALGSQAGLRQGETVVAIGYPHGGAAQPSLTSTTGVVSVARVAIKEPAPDVPPYPNVVQTDTAINPGSSGGPLVNLDQRLVGVNSAARAVGDDGRPVQGQNYAIGVDRVKEVLPELRAGRSRGWAGMAFEYPSARDLAERELASGLFIRDAVEGSPADRAGLGDGSWQLIGVDGRPVRNTLASYCAAVAGIGKGESAALSVLRAGERRPRVVRVRFP